LFNRDILLKINSELEQHQIQLSHLTTNDDLDAFVAAKKANITLFSTTPMSVPENKLSFSFDHECICKMFPNIAFETASSLLSVLRFEMKKIFARKKAARVT
jgi:hypothetical protein